MGAHGNNETQKTKDSNWNIRLQSQTIYYTLQLTVSAPLSL
jgi:hypothetical protein